MPSSRWSDGVLGLRRCDDATVPSRGLSRSGGVCNSSAALSTQARSWRRLASMGSSSSILLPSGVRAARGRSDTRTQPFAPHTIRARRTRGRLGGHRASRRRRCRCCFLVANFYCGDSENVCRHRGRIPGAVQPAYPHGGGLPQERILIQAPSGLRSSAKVHISCHA